MDFFLCFSNINSQTYGLCIRAVFLMFFLLPLVAEMIEDREICRNKYCTFLLFPNSNSMAKHDHFRIACRGCRFDHSLISTLDSRQSGPSLER